MNLISQVQEIIQGFYSISIHIFKADGFCFWLSVIYRSSGSEFLMFLARVHGLAVFEDD